MKKQNHELIHIKPNYLARCNIIFLFLLSVFFNDLHAQTLFVRELNNEQTPFTLNSIQKITFNSGNLVIKNTTGNLNQFQISGIRYVNFEDLLIGISEMKNYGENIIIYPNPTNRIIHFDFTEGNQDKINIIIVDIQGKIHFKKEINNLTEYTIDLSDLSNGLYFCVLDINDYKIIKKIIKN